MIRTLAGFFAVCSCGWAQEASTGFELRTNLTAAGLFSNRLTEAPRSGIAAAAGVRGIFYPTWRLGTNWTASAAIQVHTRPYFIEQVSTQGHGARADILRAEIGYTRFWKQNSVAIRVGQLSSAFGSFLLRYDDADNPLIDMPLTYGYYYKPVTTYGLSGAQVDLTLNRIDLRAQFTNSSPANRRGLWDRDQYGNWTGGIGYTPMQGLRVGVSGYRGPYLHRQYMYYYPGEAKPSELPASAVGVDVQWARGHWSSHGEWQRFTRSYRLIPRFTQQGGYAETRRVLHPRWYAAGRIGYLQSSVGGTAKAYEVAIGFRPNRRQLIKVGYQVPVGSHTRGLSSSVFAVQLVTMLPALSVTR